jgi:hypothetical protein
MFSLLQLVRSKDETQLSFCQFSGIGLSTNRTRSEKFRSQVCDDETSYYQPLGRYY